MRAVRDVDAVRVSVAVLKRVGSTADALKTGLNLRFVVPTRANPPEAVYHCSTRRGEHVSRRAALAAPRHATTAFMSRTG